MSPDDLVISEKLKGVDVNDRLALGRVLMLGSRSETIIGRPHIPGASVTAVVEVCPELRALYCLHQQAPLLLELALLLG